MLSKTPTTIIIQISTIDPVFILKKSTKKKKHRYKECKKNFFQNKIEPEKLSFNLFSYIYTFIYSFIYLFTYTNSKKQVQNVFQKL